MSLDNRWWKEQQYNAANDCPPAIYLAGTIWIAVGLILLLVPLLYGLTSGKFDLGGLIIIGATHLYSGLRTLTGTASGTVRHGILSVFYGLVWSMVVIMSAQPALTSPTARPYAPLLLLGIAVVGLGLLLAGYLAITASASYQRWRDPIQNQRVDTSRDFKKKTAPKSSNSGWMWVIAGVLLVTAFVGGTALFTKPGPASDDSKPSATIKDYGRYASASKGRIYKEKNLAASGGVNVLSDKDVTLLEQTDQIPCKVGERWGFRIRYSNVPADRSHTIRQEMLHPRIPQPDGSVLTKSVREIKVLSGESPDQYYGWHFLKGYEYELVAGEWCIVVFIDDVEVARKSFHVRKDLK